MFSWIREQFFGSPRSGKWPAVQRQHIRREPECIACGRSEDVVVHHILPFHEFPELELDDGVDGSGTDGNLATMCRTPCHLVHGHLMSWLRWNRDVRSDCKRYRRKIENFGSDSAE